MGKHVKQKRKRYDHDRSLNLIHRRRNEMKNDELDEYSPVEMIEERKQMIHTSRMDTRLRTPSPRRKRVGGWEKERQLRTTLSLFGRHSSLRPRKN